MNTETNEYMLLFRGPEWDEGVSTAELERRMEHVMAWFDRLSQSGKVRGGQPLARQGKMVATRQAGIMADGPFAESKEAVGGYLVLEADSFEEAVATAETCPTLDYGITIEVRPILAECPIFQRAGKKVALATA